MAKNYLPELLAPAGSLDALKAAVNSGADAVYISGKKFGARYFASNFNDSEIVSGLEYAKLRDVKVYVTVNTLIKDSQIKSAANYILWLYKIGVDAIIIQDLGLAELAKNLVPDLDLHASTQMTIHNVQGVNWAADFGFKRVILSRELKLSEVEEIKNQTKLSGIEVEIFGHGALCYSYSGQCLLSSFIGGRSGNRGMCAQPCRKAYKLVAGKIDCYGKPLNLHTIDQKEEYLLSTSDLSVYTILDKISATNIDSIKIEGRMRSPEYVAIVVQIYRKALDSMSKNKWKPNSEDISRLKLAFNRGFTEGYLTENDRNKIMQCESPGNRGLYLGDVVDYNNKTKTVVIHLQNPYKVEKGDGVVFISNDKNDPDDNSSYSLNALQKYGMALEKTPVIQRKNLLLNINAPVKIGSKLYLTRSISFNHEAASLVNNNQSPSIPIELKMMWHGNLEPILEGEFKGFDGVNYCVKLTADFQMEKAIKKPLNRNNILNQIKKTGDTPFNISCVSIEYPGDLFSPISKLNQFRRKFFEKAEEKLLSTYKPNKIQLHNAENRLNDMLKPIHHASETPNRINLKKSDIVIAAYTDTIKTVMGALEGGATRVCFEPNIPDYLKKCAQCETVNAHDNICPRCGTLKNLLSKLEAAEKLCEEHDADFVWKWPQITHQYQIEKYKQILEIKSFKEIMVDGMGASKVVKQCKTVSKISGSAGINVWNAETVLKISNIFETITPSAELSRNDLKTLLSRSYEYHSSSCFELVVQGNVDTLISADCLPSIIQENDTKNDFYGIKDMKDHIFPIKTDINCKTHVLNSVELCLIDYLAEICQIGIGSIVVDARSKTHDYARDMISTYKKGLYYVENDSNTAKNLTILKNKIKTMSTGGITVGNFIKGIKEH